MKKLSTREVSTALFLSSYKTAKLVTENEDIFPKPATMEDYEKLMLYAIAMFVVHDEVHDKLLNSKIIYDATMDIYTSILKNEVLPPDEVYDLAKNSNAVLNDFLKEHWIFMHNNDDSNGLIKYVSTILSKIPSCKDYNGYTLAGVTFASLLPQIIDAVAQYYDEIISAWDKSLDEHEETTADTQEAAAEPSQPTPPPAAQPTPEVQPEKKSTPSRSFIICILVACVSLCANVVLYNEKERLSHEATLWSNKYEEKLNEIQYWKTGTSDIYDEYKFYHDGAVIVTESGSCYHTYDCYHWNYPIWIYNVEAAKSQGYTPCKDCNPPQ